MKKSVLVCTLAVLGLTTLTACTNAEDEIKNQKLQQASATATPTATVAPTPSPTSKPKLKVKKWFSVYEDNGDTKKFGQIKINQIERLGFNDWSIGEAVKKSINYSYSVNLSVKLSKKLEDSESIKVEPVILRGKRVISKKANLGWTGFNQTADFYVGGPKTCCIEVGIQPIERIRKKKDKLGIKITFADGYERIYSVTKGLLKVKKGPKLRQTKDLVKIKSITGARYAVCINKISLGQNLNEANNNLNGKALYFDIDYQVKAFSGPTKAISIANITGSGKNACIECKANLGLNLQNSNVILYEKNRRAGRKKYYDHHLYFTYVDEGGVLRFGKQRTVTTNRKAPSGTNAKTKFVRVRVEFSEEADVMAAKQLLKFNGRYLVFQVPITQRILKSYYDK